MDPRITTLAEALHRLQAKGRHTVFYQYSGHTNTLDVRIYRGVWSRNKKNILNRIFRLDRPDLYDILHFGHTTVEEFMTLLRSLK